MATREEKNTFSIQIETLAAKTGQSHIETITTYCEEIGLEVEVAASLINDSLRMRIESEAQELRYLPRSSKLPI